MYILFLVWENLNVYGLGGIKRIGRALNRGGLTTLVRQELLARRVCSVTAPGVFETLCVRIGETGCFLNCRHKPCGEWHPRPPFTCDVCSSCKAGSENGSAKFVWELRWTPSKPVSRALGSTAAVRLPKPPLKLRLLSRRPSPQLRPAKVGPRSTVGRVGWPQGVRKPPAGWRANNDAQALDCPRRRAWNTSRISGSASGTGPLSIEVMPCNGGENTAVHTRAVSSLTCSGAPRPSRKLHRLRPALHQGLIAGGATRSSIGLPTPSCCAGGLLVTPTRRLGRRCDRCKCLRSRPRNFQVKLRRPT